MRAGMSSRRGFGSFFIGVIVGLLVVVIAVGGVIWWAYANLTIRKIEDMTKTEIIGGEDDDGVKDMKLNELIPYLTNLIENAGDLTVNKLINIFGFDIPKEISGLDISKLFDTKFSELSGSVKTLFEGMTLEEAGGILNFEMPDIPLFNRIKAQPITEAFVTLQTAIDPDSATIGSLCADFGVTTQENPVFSMLKDTKLSEMSTLDQKLQDMKVKDVLPDSTDPIILALGESKVSEIGANVKTLRLDQLLVIDETSGKILQTLGGVAINDMPDRISNLTIGEAVDVGDSKILTALQNAKLTELGTAIPALKITDFLDTAGEDNILSCLPPDTTVDTLQDNLKLAIQTTITMEKLANLAGSDISAAPAWMKNMTIPDFLAYVVSIAGSLPAPGV